MNSISTCRLCEIVKTPLQKRKVQDTLLVQTTNFEWIPGLGAFVEGYTLIVSKQHTLNTGALDRPVIQELAAFITQVRAILKKIYCIDTVVCEHGSMGGSLHGGCCVEHQHLQIFPVDIRYIPQSLIRNFKNQREISSIEDLIELNNNRIPYIYYSSGSGKNKVFETPIVTRQYLRQIMAAELKLGHIWDWREYPFEENITTFIKKIKPLIKHEGFKTN